MVTLAMACALIAAWIRSYVTADWVMANRISYHYSIRSVFGEIRGERSTISPEISPALADLFARSRIRCESVNAEKFRKKSLREYDVRWRWHYLGFEFVEATLRGQLIVVSSVKWIIPYWSIVLPLTLLSAWLILEKTRKAKDVILWE
jgi:hypothetical protein